MAQDLTETREHTSNPPTQVELIMFACGVSEAEARFMAAIEAGEITGDLIVVPDEDEPATPPANA